MTARSGSVGFACLLALVAPASAQGEKLRGIFETYPARIAERLDHAEQAMLERWRKAGRPQGVLEALRLWKPGITVTVAFLNGTDERCAQVAAVADRWTGHGNVKFSFHTADGKIRRWSSDAQEFEADIRVDLHHPDPDPFSLVGTESRDPQVVKPGEASMGFPDFHGDLPEEWEGTVLHEFGHALGFHHEHQSPTVPCDFRMEDDDDYVPTQNREGVFVPDQKNRRPGVRRLLKGPPLGYSDKAIQANFERLKVGSSMYLASDFDRDSVMKYNLPSWMFWDGENSPCYTGKRNTTLSKRDKLMMAKAYPSNPEEIRRLEEAIRQYRQRNPEAGTDGAGRAAVDLDGTWEIERQRSNGRVMPAKVLEGSTLRFTGRQRFTFSVGPLTTLTGTYQVEPKAEPKRIDLIPTGGTLKGKKLLGIYRFEGERLILCYSDPGEPRPLHFHSEPESKATLMTLIRSKNPD